MHEKSSRQICQSILNFQRGIFCAAELWHQIADSVTAKSATTILSKLPNKAQTILRQLYAAQPESLRYEPLDSDVRRVVEGWCRHV
jgi:hypothetical protein